MFLLSVSPATIPKKTSANLTQGAKAEGESRGHTGNTNSSVSSSQVQRGGRFSSGPTPGSAIDTHSQHQQQMDRDFYSQQQQQLQQQHQLQHQRQQQLAEMQHNLMARQMQLSGGRQQQNPILSHPHGHIHASHSHTHYATPQYDQAAFFQAQGQGQGPHQNTVQKGLGQMQVGQSSSRMFDDNNMTTGAALLKSEREAGQYAGGILSSLYNPDGTLCDAASLPLGGRGYVGAYSPEARRERIERFLAKRDKRVWTKKVKYDVRKNFADSRLRVKVRRT